MEFRKSKEFREFKTIVFVNKLTNIKVSS